MVTREEVLQRWREGGGFESVGRQLGMPAGRAYMIATGVPADGSDSLAPEDYDREGLQAGGSQALLGVPPHNPNRPEENAAVVAWVRERAHRDSRSRPGRPSGGPGAEPGGTES